LIAIYTAGIHRLSSNKLNLRYNTTVLLPVSLPWLWQSYAEMMWGHVRPAALDNCGWQEQDWCCPAIICSGPIECLVYQSSNFRFTACPTECSAHWAIIAEWISVRWLSDSSQTGWIVFLLYHVTVLSVVRSS